MSRSSATILRVRSGGSPWRSTREIIARNRRDLGGQAAIWLGLSMLVLWGMLGLMWVPVR